MWKFMLQDMFHLAVPDYATKTWALLQHGVQ